jgi:hypothetical protein
MSPNVIFYHVSSYKRSSLSHKEKKVLRHLFPFTHFPHLIEINNEKSLSGTKREKEKKRVFFIFFPN